MWTGPDQFDGVQPNRRTFGANGKWRDRPGGGELNFVGDPLRAGRNRVGQRDHALNGIGDHATQHVLDIVSASVGHEAQSVILPHRGRQITGDRPARLIVLRSFASGQGGIVATAVRLGRLAHAHLLIGHSPAVDFIIQLGIAHRSILKSAEQHLLLLRGVRRVVELHRVASQIFQLGKDRVQIGRRHLLDTHGVEQYRVFIRLERLELNLRVRPCGGELNLLYLPRQHAVLPLGRGGDGQVGDRAHLDFHLQRLIGVRVFCVGKCESIKLIHHRGDIGRNRTGLKPIHLQKLIPGMGRPAVHLAGLVGIHFTRVQFPVGVKHRRVVNEVILGGFKSVLHDGIALQHIGLRDAVGNVGVTTILRKQQAGALRADQSHVQIRDTRVIDAHAHLHHTY